MEVSVEVHKIINFTICSTVFLNSGGGVDNFLVRLPLIKVIKDANLRSISFRIISNMYTYPFNPQLAIKT